MEDKVSKFLSGYGDGSGSGSGSGYGYGSGYGDGDGSGYGDGYGSGYGMKINFFNGKRVYYIDDIPCMFISIHGNSACVEVISNDTHKTKKAFIAKMNGFFAHGKTLKAAFNAVKEKYLNTMDIEVKKKKFVELFPNKEKKYLIKDLYQWHGIITGSCNFGRDRFIEEHNIDIYGKMSINQFFKITENEYGGNIIKSLEEFY